MVAITNTNISNTVYETIYDYLKLQSTNSLYGTSVQPTITGSYIDDVHTFPQIVIQPVLPEETDYTFGQNNPSFEIKILIDCYATKNKDACTLGDNVSYFLRNSVFAGIHLTGIARATNFEEPNMSKVRVRTLTITYVRK